MPAPYPLRFALVSALAHSAAGRPVPVQELERLERRLRAELTDPELPFDGMNTMVRVGYSLRSLSMTRLQIFFNRHNGDF